MDRLRGLWKSVRALVFRRSAERDLDEEMSFHVDMAAAEYERQGSSPGAARRKASSTLAVLNVFGNG